MVDQRLAAIWMSAAGLVLGCSASGAPRSGGADAGLADSAGQDSARADGGCAVRCGSAGACCGSGEECIAGACAPACAGNRCGGRDELCCSGEELCVDGACTPPGSTCANDAACADGEVCEALVGRCIPLPDDIDCRLERSPGAFEPDLAWQWTDESEHSLWKHDCTSS